jgi:hypothetical protein
VGEQLVERMDRVLKVRYDEEAGVSRVETQTGVAGFSDEPSASDEYAEAGAGD